MKGSDELTMDGKPRIEWVLEHPHEARHAGTRRPSAGINYADEASRATPAASTVELAAGASSPRLVKTLVASATA